LTRIEIELDFLYHRWWWFESELVDTEGRIAFFLVPSRSSRARFSVARVFSRDIGPENISAMRERLASPSTNGKTISVSLPEGAGVVSFVAIENGAKIIKIAINSFKSIFDLDIFFEKCLPALKCEEEVR